jgi:hypothetical protein
MTILLAAALALGLAAAPSAAPPTAGGQMDSLLAAAQRAARAWRTHDFQGMVGGGPVTLSLPGGASSAPLRGSQAAELLRAFAGEARELEVEVTLARAVDRDRAYVEVLRVFTPPGSQVASRQTVYLGMRREGARFAVAEVRVVP